MTILLAASFGYVSLVTLFVIICILLVFMVVITPSQEGGMAAAFGGMGSDTFFGTKAHQHINKFTVFLAVAFLLLAVFINRYNAAPSPAAGGGATETEQKIRGLPQPQTPGTPGAPAPQPPK